SRIRRPYGSPSPHSKVLKTPSVEIEVHNADRASWICNDAFRETALRISDHPERAIFAEEPHRRFARALLACRRQVCEEWPREELVDVEVTFDHVHGSITPTTEAVCAGSCRGS